MKWGLRGDFSGAIGVAEGGGGGFDPSAAGDFVKVRGAGCLIGERGLLGTGVVHERSKRRAEELRDAPEGRDQRRALYNRDRYPAVAGLLREGVRRPDSEQGRRQCAGVSSA